MFSYRFLRIFLVLSVIVFFGSCNNESKIENDISKIEVDFIIERFDKLFYESSPSDLPEIKGAYPFLFPSNVPDSIWISTMNDSMEKVLYNEVDAKFSNLNPIKDELSSLFQHMKYYDRGFKIPSVITLINGVDYRSKVAVTDSVVLIALDNYLGPDHEFYQNISKFISNNMSSEQIVPDITEFYSKKYLFQDQRKTFIDEMVYWGKILYFKDVMIPFKSDAEKIGYSEDQLLWAQENEAYIWSYFIEKELLYSTDSKLPSRFINPSPFSKFYLELDNESPGRIGAYMGWQIVKSYAENSQNDIFEIMSMNPESLYKQAKFKPRK